MGSDFGGLDLYKITVIIPVYNMGRYLEECLDSIVHQTIDGLEVIAVNDGSTDNSLEILNRYADKYKNIIVHSQKNQGQASAKNYGILHATGKYIIFMDPDDYYPDNTCLKRIFDCTEKNKALIGAGIILQNSNGILSMRELEHNKEFYTNHFVDVKDYDNVYNHTRYLFNRELIIKNNIMFPSYKRYEDQPFTVKALALAEKFYATDIPMYVYRIEHKALKYSLPVCKDIVCGIRDTIELCSRHGLEKMYKRCFEDFRVAHLIPFYKFSYNGDKEFDVIIEDFNRVMFEWRGNEFQPLTKEEICRYRKCSIEHYTYITDIMQREHPVILYGAGKRAEYFLKICNGNYQNILGFAISGEVKVDEFCGMKVRNISEYCSEELKQNGYVFVTTSLAYREEIEETLNRMGFLNVIYPDVTMLLLGKTMTCDN